MKYTTKSSGKKQEFNTGAHRDTQDGKGRFDLIPLSPLQRIAGVFERGAKIYGERNWEQGMPLTRYLDSAIRHAYQAIYKPDDEEDHAAAAAWNLIAFMHTREMIEQGVLPKELDNLPKYEVAKCSCGPEDGCSNCPPFEDVPESKRLVNSMEEEQELQEDIFKHCAGKGCCGTSKHASRK